MAAKPSAEMRHAVMLVTEDKKSVYDAARIANVHPASLYKVLKGKGIKKFPRKLDATSA